eukprot:scaffold107083_cov75-Phaeocystis_antarctica.AAC.1
MATRPVPHPGTPQRERRVAQDGPFKWARLLSGAPVPSGALRPGRRACHRRACRAGGGAAPLACRD